MPRSLLEKAFLKRNQVHENWCPHISVDVAVFTIMHGKLMVLISQPPGSNAWSLLSGNVDPNSDYDLEDVIFRKVSYHTRNTPSYIEQVASVGNADRDIRGWSICISYFAFIVTSVSNEEVLHNNCLWVAIDEAEKSDRFVLDHISLLKQCITRLRDKGQYTSLPIYLLATTFTLTELQRTFELVLGMPLEKKSFRRRMLDADLLEDTGLLKNSGNRPAKIYRAKPRSTLHVFKRILEGPR